MADITLSKAVRSNLLNLQSTATQLGKTQQRLATGLKVNSALDNPTNFFTSSSLNSRAGDLGRLLDAVGNATQTIEAADNGLSAITKLVESAQATARQALQTTGQQTTNSVTGSTSATFNPSSFSSVSGDNSVATGTGGGPLAADAAATVATGSIAGDSASVTATGAAQAVTATVSGVAADATAAFATFDSDALTDGAALSTLGLAATDSVTFTINGVDKTVNFLAANAGAVTQGADTVSIEVDATVETFVTALNDLFNGTGGGTNTDFSVSRAGGGNNAITFTSASTVDSLQIAGDAASTLASLGLEAGDVAESTAIAAATGTTGAHVITKNADIEALIASGDTSITLTSSVGGGAQAVTLGAGSGEVATLAQLVTAFDGLTNVGATATADGVIITETGTDGTLTFGGDAAALTALGVTTTPLNSEDNTLASIGVASGDSFIVTVDGTDHTVTFDATSAGTLSSGNLTIGVNQDLTQFASQLNAALGSSVTASITNGQLAITSTTADAIRVRDGAQGTNTAELGFGAIGDAYTAGGALGGTVDRLVTNNTDVQALAAAGATLNISVGGVAQTALAFGGGAGQISNKSDLITALNNLANLNATGTAGSAGTITLDNSDANDQDSSIAITADSGTTLTALGLTADSGSTVTSTTQATNLLTRGDVTQGDTIDIKVGKSAKLTVTFGTGTNEVSTIGELNSALQNLAGGSASVDSNGEINITSDVAGQPIVVGGSTGALSSFGLTSGETSSLIDGSNIAAGDKLNIQVGTNSQLTVTFGTGTGQVNTFEELQSALANLAGGSASIDKNSGAITVKATNGADSIVISSTDSLDAADPTVAAAFGLTAGTTTAVTTDSAQRTTLESQYNDLLTQINQLSEDASFNGVNLLNGDDLNVIFNEDGSSKLDIQGVTFNSTGLGLSRVASGSFQTDGNINNVLSALDGAISSLRSQSSTFGSNLSVVETRQDFTKKMINTLETGGANLTLADTNEEAANLLALQTRQQLSSTALSLASQSDQNVLRLF